MKKINKNFILFTIVIYILLSLYLIINLLNTKANIFYGEENLNYKFNKINLKKECNFSFLGKNSIFTSYQIKEVKKKTKAINYTSNKIYIKNNIIYYKNKKFLYLGDLVKNNNKYSIFLYSGKNTKFYNLKIFDKLDDTNLTLISDNNYKLVFENKDKNFTLKKSYINIKTFQKDINETNNSK